MLFRSKQTQAGGAQGTGGSTQPGSGGTTVAEPQIVTSAQNAYWKESTWTEVTSGTVDVTVNDGTAYQTWARMSPITLSGWRTFARMKSNTTDCSSPRRCSQVTGMRRPSS